MLSLPKSKWLRRSLWIVFVVFLLMNVIAFIHAWKFTHFSTSGGAKTKKPQDLSQIEKLTVLLTGVSNPKPMNKTQPEVPFKTIELQSNKKIECWEMNVARPKGTVILFHGFGGFKSSLLSRASVFMNMGYNCLLVDFMGSGNSEGNQTTIGFFEAKQVSTCYRYVQNKGERNVFLFGTSMGAVAIMKALSDEGLKPSGIILECPFGTMYKTTCARFRAMKVPAFPMAGLLVFWGGAQNGFWAFGHNPETYAKQITCPVLLMSGTVDKSVSLEEINSIYENIKGKKHLRLFKNAGHENYMTRYKAEWEREVVSFMK